MALHFKDGVVDRMEEIYRAQEKPRFYKWTIDLNDQWVYLEERIHRAGIDFTVTGVRQNCDNMHVTIDGDPDQVAWMDMALLVWSNNKRCKHLLVLEHKG
ncbi:hypothetical protein HL10_gp253 [Cronobacter phage CR8]|uniref:Uncharacterized protein n=2 Tax=Certrevirus TaxID=1914850 RepID=A0A060AMQ6_9CAUD|nr:hypothetical protein HL10_gp253 [Cronobacter phage CR8]YP_009188954.1 hypothetical protein ADU18_0090 [Cronobacter phage PBES 02]AIA64783.1 hypothetical protein CR8_253 [Cronobacter phage CR8]AKY03993.1 hypothetical protein ADU18_0090 [Cronobacter phage PBES 02]